MSNDATFQRIVVLQPRSNPSFLHGIGCTVREIAASGGQLQSTQRIPSGLIVIHSHLFRHFVEPLKAAPQNERDFWRWPEWVLKDFKLVSARHVEILGRCQHSQKVRIRKSQDVLGDWSEPGKIFASVRCIPGSCGDDRDLYILTFIPVVYCIGIRWSGGSSSGSVGM